MAHVFPMPRRRVVLRPPRPRRARALAALVLVPIFTLSSALGCGGEEAGPASPTGFLALEGEDLVAVDPVAATVTPVAALPAGVVGTGLRASADNRRVALIGDGGDSDVTLHVLVAGSWQLVVDDATTVYTTTNLEWFGFSRDATSAAPGTTLFRGDGTMVFESATPRERFATSTDGRLLFVRDGEMLRVFDAGGAPERSFNPMIAAPADWRPRFGNATRVLLGVSNAAAWYSLDGVRGEETTADGAGVGYLLEEGTLTYARDDRDIEVATGLPMEATTARISDVTSVAMSAGGDLVNFSPSGAELTRIVPLSIDGTTPAQMRTIAPLTSSLGVYVSEQGASMGFALVRYEGAEQSQVGTLPDGGDFARRPDEATVAWAEGGAVRALDRETGELETFGSVSAAILWASYQGFPGHIE